MSWQAISWAWNLRGISPTAKLVAVAIADCYHPANQQNSESIERLAEFVGVSEEELMEALTELEHQAGLKYTALPFPEGRVAIQLPVEMENRRPKAPVERKARPHWIYVISSKGATKIGISRDVQKRFDALQAWTPEPLRVEWVTSGPKELICRIEAACHAAMADKRAFSEWFYVEPNEAIALVKKIMAEQEK